MPKYNYTAVDLENKKVQAVIEARDDKHLWKLLRNQNLIPIKYKILDDGKQSNYRLKANETAELSRQLSSMLKSGITLVRAMEILKDRDFKPKIKAIYERLYKDVQQGYTLSEAMRLQPKAFPELLINMYASGEASGQLEHVAAKMAVQYEKEHHLNGKVKSAMTYPAVLFVVTVVVVMIIFIFILPEFFKLFEDLDQIPLLTRGIIAMSGFLQSYWYFVILGTLILLGIIQYLITIPKVALKVDYAKLCFPVVGKLLKIIYTARFSRTLSSLYSSGVSMLNALEITATIIGNKYIENQFEDVVKNVRNGESLNESIGLVDGFDKMLITSILIGEESGRLDSMLESTANNFDYESEMASKRLVSLLEPIMIVFMAIVIGIIMMAVMMPIITLYQNIE